MNKNNNSLDMNNNSLDMNHPLVKAILRKDTDLIEVLILNAAKKTNRHKNNTEANPQNNNILSYTIQYQSSDTNAEDITVSELMKKLGLTLVHLRSGGMLVDPKTVPVVIDHKIKSFNDTLLKAADKALNSYKQQFKNTCCGFFFSSMTKLHTISGGTQHKESLATLLKTLPAHIALHVFLSDSKYGNTTEHSYKTKFIEELLKSDEFKKAMKTELNINNSEEITAKTLINKIKELPGLIASHQNTLANSLTVALLSSSTP